MIIDGVKYSWTQPACDTCFAGLFPNVTDPALIKEEFRADERCCLCNASVRNGLYIRINPTTVPHPTPEDTDE